jgi:WD40 repeat protein
MCVTFSRNGQIMVSGSRDRTIKIWRPAYPVPAKIEG